MTDLLKGEAKKKWDELTGFYNLNEKTEDVMLSICKCHARFLEAEEQMDEKGMLYKSPSGKIEQSPLIAIANNMQKEMKAHFKFLEKYRFEEE